MKSLFALFLLPALALAAAPADDTAPRETLLKADRAFAAAAQTRGVEAWVDVWAENGVHPDGPRVAVEGKTVVRTGDYITVWEKQDDGAWKVAFDTDDRDSEPESVGVRTGPRAEE